MFRPMRGERGACERAHGGVVGMPRQKLANFFHRCVQESSESHQLGFSGKSTRPCVYFLGRRMRLRRFPLSGRPYLWSPLYKRCLGIPGLRWTSGAMLCSLLRCSGLTLAIAHSYLEFVSCFISNCTALDTTGLSMEVSHVFVSDSLVAYLHSETKLF